MGKTSDLPCNPAEKLRPNFPYASGTVCWLFRRREVFSLRFFNFLLTKIVVSGMLYVTIIVVKLTGVLVRRGARPCRWKTD